MQSLISGAFLLFSLLMYLVNDYNNRNSCYDFILYCASYILHGARGGAVGEALRYKPKGRGFDSR